MKQQSWIETDPGYIVITCACTVYYHNCYCSNYIHCKNYSTISVQLYDHWSIYIDHCILINHTTHVSHFQAGNLAASCLTCPLPIQELQRSKSKSPIRWMPTGLWKFHAKWLQGSQRCFQELSNYQSQSRTSMKNSFLRSEWGAMRWLLPKFQERDQKLAWHDQDRQEVVSLSTRSLVALARCRKRKLRERKCPCPQVTRKVPQPLLRPLEDLAITSQPFDVEAISPHKAIKTHHRLLTAKVQREYFGLQNRPPSPKYKLQSRKLRPNCIYLEDPTLRLFH